MYESVSAGRKYQGLEHWLPLFYEKLDTFFSYFPSATAKQYVVLTTLNAVLQKVPCSSVVKSYGFKAVVGRNINESNLREFLVRMGFTLSLIHI